MANEKTKLRQSDEDASSSVKRLNDGSVINPASGNPSQAKKMPMLTLTSLPKEDDEEIIEALRLLAKRGYQIIHKGRGTKCLK